MMTLARLTSSGILLFLGTFAIIGIVLTSGCMEQSEQRTSGEVLGDNNSVTPAPETDSTPAILSEKQILQLDIETPKIDSTPSILSEKQILQLDIDNAPYNISEYQENIFDCSNMAALLHDWLETQTQTKWNVEVWYGCESPSCREGHEWLEVIGNVSNFTIEVTSKTIEDYWGNSNESYREHYSYFNRHFSFLPKGSGGFIDPKENIYPKRW
ncbi:MAG TPA: hypothetical protein VKL21_11550 [Candidatus Methanoperedens sp.]|nr:hypothetical protein [Candidatus Methanoperedens sp.]